MFFLFLRFNMQVKHIIRSFVFIKFLVRIALCSPNCFHEARIINYFKIKSCHRSELSVIGLKDVDGLQDCAKFARERNGLAFNFSPPDAKGIKVRRGSYSKNCQILSCPELGNSTTLILDEKFDYYSAFGNLNTTMNATCIRSAGVFSVMQSTGNYIETITNCQKIGADLADILSETRTNELANLINATVSTWFKASYVGLDDITNEGIYESSNGNYLHCIEYRAWGPGHPRSKRKSEDCATLDVDKTWKIVPCAVKLTGVCEFFPTAPDMDELDMKYLCNNIQGRRKKKRCLVEKKRLRKLIEKSPRLDKCALLYYDNSNSTSTSLRK